MTWEDAWNEVVRKKIFPDQKLKEQMLADDASPVDFIDQYFIEGASTGEQQNGLDVRVIYYDEAGMETANPYVQNKTIAFDIYVNERVLRGVDGDYLKRRDKAIFRRIVSLLPTRHSFAGLRFYVLDEYPMQSRTIGYQRYHGIQRYKRTY